MFSGLRGEWNACNVKPAWSAGDSRKSRSASRMAEGKLHPPRLRVGGMAVRNRRHTKPAELLLQLHHRPAHGLADEHVGLGIAVVMEALVARRDLGGAVELAGVDRFHRALTLTLTVRPPAPALRLLTHILAPQVAAAWSRMRAFQAGVLQLLGYRQRVSSGCMIHGSCSAPPFHNFDQGPLIPFLSSLLSTFQSR